MLLTPYTKQKEDFFFISNLISGSPLEGTLLYFAIQVSDFIAIGLHAMDQPQHTNDGIFKVATSVGACLVKFIVLLFL